MADTSRLFTNLAPFESPDPGKETINGMIAAIDAQTRITGQSCFIINYDTCKLIYRSENMMHADEASAEDIQRECVNPYWSLISDKTLETLVSIENFYPTPGNNFLVKNYAHHTNIIEFPIILKKRDFFICQKFTPLYIRPDGYIKLGLFVIGNTKSKKITSKIITADKKIWEYNFKKREYIEIHHSFELSQKERKIMQLSRRGMTIEEISSLMCLSGNTVKTHRKHIFQKLGATSINEALTTIDNFRLLK